MRFTLAALLTLSLAALSSGQVFPGAIAGDSDLGVQVNAYRDTLNGGIDNAVTTFVVNTGTGAAANIYMRIDNEAIFCRTWIAGTKTFSDCTRGADGTPAASHSTGAAITGVIVASHHNKLADEVIAIETTLGANLANVPGIAGCGTPAELTMTAGGQITLTGSACFRIDTFADAASQNLTSIVCAAGQRAVLVAENDARTVVVKRGAGMEIPADFSLDNQYDSIQLYCRAANTIIEIARSNGGP